MYVCIQWHRTHLVSWSHMLMKQSHIFGTVSQDVLRGRPEHVLHDLESRPSFINSALLGSCPEITIVVRPMLQQRPRQRLLHPENSHPLAWGVVRCCYHKPWKSVSEPLVTSRVAGFQARVFWHNFWHLSSFQGSSKYHIIPCNLMWGLYSKKKANLFLQGQSLCK